MGTMPTRKKKAKKKAAKRPPSSSQKKPAAKPRKKAVKKKAARSSGEPQVVVKQRSDRAVVNRELRKREYANKRTLERTGLLRDIANTPEFGNVRPLDLSQINWERRNACRKDPLLDLKTYMPGIFYLDWASYQKDLIGSIEDKIRDGGKQAFGCPRGGGKTAICRGMIIRATKFGWSKFAFFVGSKEPKAIQTLRAVKGLLYRSRELYQDFPEICYPIYRIEGRGGNSTAGQLYNGERTHLNWSAQEVQFPTMLFTEEEVRGYLENEPESVIYLPDEGIDVDRFVIASSGTIIRVAGIDGSIRGEAELHPVLLTQPRPDLVLLDDVQKDQRADSPKACEDLERLIESAIDYLAAPDVNQCTLMPCTVIREDDVSDTYLTRIKKVEWNGERHGIISQYPPGFDDDSITDETKQGELWLEYAQIREQSFLEHGDNRLGNEFYIQNRKVMDEGFKISWENRFKQSSDDPNKNEVSAIQAAFNWRFKDIISFHSEAQNRPRRLVDSGAITITADHIATHTTGVHRKEIVPQWPHLVGFLDIQNEIMFHTILACDSNFTGQFIDYGTIPEVKTTYFRKNQTYGWKLLSKMFFKRYPERREEGSKGTAPFEQKIYFGLQIACDHLLSQKYTCNQTGVGQPLRALAIDMKWGAAMETVKRFIREYNDPRIIGYQGHAFLPSHKQLEENDPTDGWLYEHEQFPHVQESKWVIKTDKTGFRYILADVNRLKTDLMKRLGSPKGSQGCITVFPSTPVQHRMFAEHIASSEIPERLVARGMEKDCWKLKPGEEDDNDFLDTATGCICMASICGASVKSEKAMEYANARRKAKRSLREAFERKRKTAS